MMQDNASSKNAKSTWIAPDIRELDVRETARVPGAGADIGGNPDPDCQLS